MWVAMRRNGRFWEGMRSIAFSSRVSRSFPSIGLLTVDFRTRQSVAGPTESRVGTG